MNGRFLVVPKLIHPLEEPLFYKIPAHAASSLFESGIDSVRELVAQSPESIRDIRGIGKKRYEQIEQLVEELDLGFGVEISEQADRPLPEPIRDYYRYIHSATRWWDRGVKYIRKDRVVSCDPEDGSVYSEADLIHSRVRGSNTYDVQLTIREEGFRCSCPAQGEWTHWGGPCKHVIAATIEVACQVRREQLVESETVSANWKRIADRLETEEESGKPDSLVFLLDTDARIPRLTPAFRDEDGSVVPQEGPPDSNAEFMDERDRLVLSRIEAAIPRPGLPVPAEEMESVLSDVLPLFTDEKLYVRRNGENILVSVESDEIDVTFELDEEKDDLKLRANLHRTDRFTGSPEFLLMNPPWVLAEGNELYPVDASSMESKLLETIPAEGLDVPPDELGDFARHFLPLLQRNDVDLNRGESLETAESVEPNGRLELEEKQQTLLIRFLVEYGDTPVTPGNDQPIVSYDETEQTFRTIQRQPKREKELRHQFTDTNVTESGRYNDFYRPTEDPMDWLVEELPRLTEKGFEVYGEESLTRYRRPREPTKTEVVVSGETDWFDVEGEVEYEDRTVPLSTIKEAVTDGKRYINIGDDRRGLIPEKWLERWADLFEWSRRRGDGLEAPRATAGWLDELVDEVDDATVDDAFRETLDQLRSIDPESSLPTPEGFEGTLRPYQEEGLAWLTYLNEAGLGAMLADDMGLGKTIQVLALIRERRNRDGEYPYTMVVAPRSVLRNWEREINRFVPDVSVYRHHGTDRIDDPTDWDDPDLILTTYGTLLRDIETVETEFFDLVVLDESHRIRNPNTKRAKAARALDADHRVCLTGTPVQNTTMDLWSQFQFLNPGFLGTKAGFKRALAKPIEESRNEDATDRLQSLIRPFLMRRTKEEVEPDLPDLSESTVDCELTGQHRAVYDETLQQYRRMLDESIEESGLDDSRFLILEGLTRLRQICCDPGLVKDNGDITSAKVQMFEEKAREAINNDHRILVFSQFVEFLKVLRVRADEEGWKYEYLDGQTRDRMEIVDRFQANEDIPLFFISLKAGGEGLNLTGANYVFLMDPWWNPAAEQQAADRTHRIGQDSRVFVYRFLCPDTIEDKIQDLKNRKRQVEADLLDPETGLFRQLDESDIHSLFELDPVTAGV